MKRKILLSPLLIIVLIFVAGIGIAGAAILIGNSGDNSPSTAVDLQRGLIGWWKFDGDAKDATPYRHHGTVTGATLNNDRKGQANKAYSFDGATNRIVFVNDGSTLGLTTTATFSFWVKINTQTDTRRIFGYTSSYAQNGQWLFYHTATVLTFGIDNNDVNTGCSKTIDLTTAWHHIVGTISSSGIGTLYVDGASQCFSPAATGNYNNTNPIGIGANNATLDFNGSIDAVRIYNRVLSQAEITALYQEYNPGLQVSDLQKGLVGQWKMDGNAKDSTPNRNHGTVTGAVLANDRKEEAQRAYGFNGTSRIDVAHNSSLNAVNNQVSMAGWFKFDAVGVYQRLIVKTVGGPTFSGYTLEFHPSSTDVVQMRISDGSATNNFPSTSTLTAGAWYHLVGVWNGTSGTIYINGVLDKQTNITTTINNSNAALSFGALSPFTNPFAGQMDDLRIYNRALTATEVTALYQEYNPGIQISDLQKGLVGWWPLDGNAKDRTPYRTHFTITGGASLANDRKGEAQKAYLLGSSSNYLNAASLTGFPNPTTKISVAAWFKLNSNKDWNRIVARDNWATAGKVSWLLFTDSNSRPIFGVSNGTTQNNATTATSTLATGTWYHVVGTYDGVIVKVYLNGVIGSTTGSASSLTFDPITLLIVGASDAGNFLDGFADDVRIWNRALTQTEVTALYQSY